MSTIARGCVFFYGHTKGEHACFSQFYPSEFLDEDGQAYNCAEQYMMASKARCMGDVSTLSEILSCAYDPKLIKALGRRVSPYDEELWEATRLACVTHGNYLKFSQNPKLCKILLSTGEHTLVEAAPNDRIWGIGVSVNDAAAGKTWRGHNLLGQALMASRTAIVKQQPVPQVVFSPAVAQGLASDSTSASARAGFDACADDAGSGMNGRADLAPDS